MRAHRALVLALMLCACGGSPAATDAGSVDAGATPTDTGTTPTDTGTALVDAAVLPDTGPIDAGPAPDGCPTTFAGCTTFDDHTADTTVAIAFDGFAYAPRCIRVQAGTVITIPASALHPLHGATCSPEGGPLPELPGAATEANGDYTLTTPGAYGYYCNNHGTDTGAGMAGLILVE